MTMNRHEAWEELISASLTGDLTADERRRLDAHLDGCAQCRASMAAFADQRRIVSGLRHVAPPRDLGARVRAGIEYQSVPWWRRPALIFTAVGGSLAAVAGALLALVLLNGPAGDPQVGRDVSPTPFASTPAPSASGEPQASGAVPTLPPPVESGAPVESAEPSVQATPDDNPIAQSSPEPDLYLAFDPATPTDDQALAVVEGPSGDVVLEPEPPPDPATAAAEPIAAELSPDGQWLAYISRIGQSGMTEVSATRVGEGIASNDPEALPPVDSPIDVGQTVILGQGAAGSPFLERLAWSSNGAYLAYTVADPAGGGTDAWLFDVAAGQPRQLTDVGNAYAASWVPGGAGTSLLWVSTAGDTPVSYLHAFHDSAADPAQPGLGGSLDPADNPTAEAQGVFQPLVSPNGTLAIHWKGRMALAGGEWLFSEAGAPYLSEHHADQADAPFPNERLLFSDVTIDRDAFASAAIAWGLDSNTYAVWSTAWTGLPQSDEGAYPDPARVYFGHASDARGLTRVHAIDRTDLPADWEVIDVKVSPTGRHLVVMVARPSAGVLDPATARLLLIERNTGSVEDVVEPIGDQEGRWFGPAVFDAFIDVEGEQVEAP
jgi:hypothetical protein